MFSVYGLRLESDLHIPGLVASLGTTRSDVRVRFGCAPWWPEPESLTNQTVWYRSPDLDQGQPLLTIWNVAGAWLCWRSCDGTEFLIHRSTREIWARWPCSLTLEDTATYLLGPVLSLVLRLRGITSLHASAVRIGEHAIALVGPPGAGKSTLAAALALRGHRVLTDDVAALAEQRGEVLIQPGYPRLRLWPECPDGPLGFTASLPRLTPNWDKRYLPLTAGESFQQEAVPLAAIYMLEERTGASGAPFVRPCSPCDGFMGLIANINGKELLDDELRTSEFRLVSRLVERVHVRRVTPHTDPAALGLLCDCVLEDLHNVTSCFGGKASRQHL